MESWSILDRIVRGVVRRRKRLALITGLVALFILMPLAYLVSKEPPRYRASADIERNLLTTKMRPRSPTRG